MLNQLATDILSKVSKLEKEFIEVSFPIVKKLENCSTSDIRLLHYSIKSLINLLKSYESFCYDFDNDSESFLYRVKEKNIEEL